MCSLQVGGVMGLWAHVALYNNGSGKACKLSSLPWPWGLMSSRQGYELKRPNTLCRALLKKKCQKDASSTCHTAIDASVSCTRVLVAPVIYESITELLDDGVRSVVDW